jgi:hypothetical protein
MTVVCGHLVTSKKVPKTSRNCRRRRRDDCLESINASTPSHSAIKLGMVSDSDSVGGRMDGGKMLLLIVFIASMAKIESSLSYFSQKWLIAWVDYPQWCYKKQSEILRGIVDGSFTIGVPPTSLIIPLTRRSEVLSRVRIDGMNNHKQESKEGMLLRCRTFLMPEGRCARGLFHNLTLSLSVRMLSTEEVVL